MEEAGRGGESEDVVARFGTSMVRINMRRVVLMAGSRSATASIYRASLDLPRGSIPAAV